MGKNYILIVLGILVSIISLVVFAQTNYLFLTLVYSALLVISGLYYNDHKIFFWLGFVCILPLALLFYFQLFKRLRFLVNYIFDIKNPSASPPAFLYGLLLELPYLTLISCYFYNLYRFLKTKTGLLI